MSPGGQEDATSSLTKNHRARVTSGPRISNGTWRLSEVSVPYSSQPQDQDRGLYQCSHTRGEASPSGTWDNCWPHSDMLLNKIESHGNAFPFLVSFHTDQSRKSILICCFKWYLCNPDFKKREQVSGRDLGKPQNLHPLWFHCIFSLCSVTSEFHLQ